MPLTGFVCPPGATEPGRRNPVQFCVQECATPCTLPPLIAAIHAAERQNYHQGAYISASMLASGGCPRQTWLERRVEFYDTIRRRFWSFRGGIVHAMVEGAPQHWFDGRWVQELSMHCMLEFPELPAPLFNDDGTFSGAYHPTEHLTLRLNGTCDAYDTPHRTLWDCKTTGDYKLDQFIRGKDFGDGELRHIDPVHIMQMQVYAYLLARTPMPDDIAATLGVASGTLFPKPEAVVIQKIGMMDIARSGFLHETKKYGKSTLHAIEHCPVYADDVIEAWIRPRALQWYRWLVLGEQPPVVTEDASWLCRSCQFYGHECVPEPDRAAGLTYDQQTDVPAAVLSTAAPPRPRTRRASSTPSRVTPLSIPDAGAD